MKSIWMIKDFKCRGNMFKVWKIFRKLQKSSESIYGDKNRLFKLIKESGVKSLSVKSFDGIRKELSVLFSLLKDYINGSYRGIKKSSMIMIISALVYLLNPLDVLPDFIIGLGFMDDLSVFTYLLTKIKGELDKYKDWKGM